MVLWLHHETLASSAVERKYGSSEDEMAFAGFQHAPALRKSERVVQASREQQAIINSLAEVCSRKESSSELPEAAAEVDAALTLDEREALPQEVPTKAAGGDEAVSAVGGGRIVPRAWRARALGTKRCRMSRGCYPGFMSARTPFPWRLGLMSMWHQARRVSGC